MKHLHLIMRLGMIVVLGYMVFEALPHYETVRFWLWFGILATHSIVRQNRIVLDFSFETK